MNPAIEELRRRAGAACEYCRMPEAFDPEPFQVDHIIAMQHGGPTEPANLALACRHCNNHKGPNVGGIEPTTHRLVRLFHPRRDRWTKHFAWDGPTLVGLTSNGRATIEVLAINAPFRVLLRADLIDEGVFPPAGPTSRRNPGG